MSRNRAKQREKVKEKIYYIRLDKMLNSIINKQEQVEENKVSTKDVFGMRDLTPFNALVQIPKRKTILYK